MKIYLYKGKVVTASSKEEAIVVASSSTNKDVTDCIKFLNKSIKDTLDGKYTIKVTKITNKNDEETDTKFLVNIKITKGKKTLPMFLAIGFKDEDGDYAFSLWDKNDDILIEADGGLSGAGWSRQLYDIEDYFSKYED